MSKLFRPFISKSHIKNNPLAFNIVDKILANIGLYKFFKDKEALEDMTQMYVEYGDLYFNAGIAAL
ncbi:hypothetical protein Curi_c02230 [Gottschalkia acidurici 9a]|uniref:Uncharacterized protein n=1 Tax=Gottschalkia acidurici (strain ATCC 7906 / DSM 604 / BCRC 14475 / CIP 104303 / KCTC 5404 / NCIMB 10678 / 9a) TaxID=1128398 RepID=K0ATY2_GOTA9|nr:hypothetical protein [Gottschalkia acidurici]AFS77303.1 hypothetical protein Curi_c02230 [Gottschalkia acidurici 9a]